jgi:hypothetical protein
MKTAAICLCVTIGVASRGALAQDAGDAVEKLRACSQLQSADRLECLQKLSRDLAPPPSPASPSASDSTGAGENWTVSETTSPIDYTPITVATASSPTAPGGAAMQLSIQCRSGRTDLVIDGSTLTRRGEDYAISYAVNGGQAVSVGGGTPASGSGVALKGDVVPLLASLPDRGTVTFRVAGRQDPALEGRYSLPALKIVLDRLAGPCKWPIAGAFRNR